MKELGLDGSTLSGLVKGAADGVSGAVVEPASAPDAPAKAPKKAATTEDSDVE